MEQPPEPRSLARNATSNRLSGKYGDFVTITLVHSGLSVLSRPITVRFGQALCLPFAYQLGRTGPHAQTCLKFKVPVPRFPLTQSPHKVVTMALQLLETHNGRNVRVECRFAEFRYKSGVVTSLVPMHISDSMYPMPDLNMLMSELPMPGRPFAPMSPASIPLHLLKLPVQLSAQSAARDELEHGSQMFGMGPGHPPVVRQKFDMDALIAQINAQISGVGVPRSDSAVSTTGWDALFVTTDYVTSGSAFLADSQAPWTSTIVDGKYEGADDQRISGKRKRDFEIVESTLLVAPPTTTTPPILPAFLTNWLVTTSITLGRKPSIPAAVDTSSSPQHPRPSPPA
jgi:hypothetical protein